jgi:cell division protein FtsQ
VNWGGGDQADLKARVLAVLMRQQATHYDVSAPQAPAYS